MYVHDSGDSRHLFSDYEDHLNEVLDAAVTGPSVDKFEIDGLQYVADFISREEEQTLLELVDHSPWNTIWQRRTQFYGQRYDSWEGSTENKCTEMPCWAKPIAGLLVSRGLFAAFPDQLGVNEYLPGQGIAPHVDRHCGPVASISLGSGCVMDLISMFGKPTISFWLSPRSVVIMEGEARSAWKHGIARRQRDIIDGVAYRRRRRVSLIFRKIDWQWPSAPEPHAFHHTHSGTSATQIEISCD